MNTKILLWLYEQGKRDFSGIRLRNAKLTRANLRFACLSRSHLEGANLNHALLIGTDFVYAHLQSSKFVEANCLGGNFLAANLQRADLSHASLAGGVFNGANLSYANLESAVLTGAEMRAANLQGANLSNANLDGANLRAANLYGANLEGTSLEGADLSGAIMPDAELEETLEEPSPITTFAPVQAAAVQSQSLAQSVWDSDEPQTFEAIAIEQDPESRSAAQKAIEAAWGSTEDSESAEDSDDSLTVVERWQTLLNEGLGRAFNLENMEDAQTRLKRSLMLRKGVPQLRMKMLQAYENRCALSRCTVEDVLEVAYIIPYLGDKTNEPENLLLMRSDLHVLFDMHLLSIDPDELTIHLAPWIQDSHYGSLEGRSLMLPLNKDFRPNLELLRQHWEECEWEREESWPVSYVM